MLRTLKDFWTGLKDWFHNSETILLARAEAFAGFLIVTIGGMDWSPLFSLFGTGTAFTKNELYGIGGVMLAKGIFGEWARRRNTIEVNSKLIPTEIVKEVKTEVTTTESPVTTVTTETVTK